MRLSARALASFIAPVLSLAGLAALAPAASASPAGDALVINEVYGGGGNAGAAYTNDFVELYNPTSAPVSLSGMSLQYRSATSTALPGTSNVNTLSGTVAAHGHFLVQLAAGNTPVAALPAPDLAISTSPINLSGTGGQVYLVDDTAAVAAQTNTAAPWTFAPSVVDFVGWGSASVFEGTAHAGATTNGTSISRATTGVDTDDNAADFAAATAPSPQNAASDAVKLTVADQSATVGAAFSYVPGHSGGTAALTWSQTGLPTWASFDPATGAITGTPDAAGSWSVTVTATDGSTSDTQTFTITARDDTPVTVSSLADRSATVGAAITEIDPTATGGTGDGYTWDATGLPAGVSIDHATGAITGTPTAAGISSVTVSATDKTDTTNVGTASFKLTVNTPVAATSPHLVVSEVYSDGGYDGSSAFSSDFVELYNQTASDIDLGAAGVSIAYAKDNRAAGDAPTATKTLTGVVPAGGHYLIKLGGAKKSGYTGSTGPAIPTPDADWSATDLYYASGVVYLYTGSTPSLPVGNIDGLASNVIDLATYGSADTFEGSALGTALSQSSSAYRRDETTDTDDNHADFTVGTPNPTNAAGTSGTAGGGASCDSSLPAPSSIADVQGTSDTSPYAGCSVTVQGVVTADYATGGFDGFTLQTAGTGGTTDTTPGQSDAIFVYGASAAGAVHTGDSVSVSGTVQEFGGETELGNVSVTPVTPALAAVTPAQLAWSDLDTDAKREAHESELVAPQGDYTVTDNYDLNYYGTIVLAADSTKPLSDPTDVATPGSADAQATAAYNAGHTITLDDGSSWNYATTHTGDPLPWLTASHSVTIGAHTTFGTGGVILDYRNAGWTYQPTHQVTDTGTDVATFTDLRATANAAPQPVGGDIRLATFNMENYFVETGQKFVADGLGTCTYYKDRDGNPITDNTCTFADGSPGPRGAATTESFQRQLAKEVYGVNHLGASIVSLEEVENSTKYGEDRDHALSVFVDALNAATAPGTWAYIPTGSLNQPPIDAQDVIRSAFIYKPADVTPVGPASILSDDSGSGQAFSIAREPLAQAFKGAGQGDDKAFLVVSNHFKSKGADANGLFDDCGAGKGDAENTDPAADEGGFNCTRVHEANDMSTWAEGLAQTDGIAPIFMLGDFNAYTHEDPLEALYAKGYQDLQTAENGAGAKATYSYGGLEGSLDHVLGNAAAVAMVTGADVWQIDGQEPVAYVYSRYNYNVTQLFSADNPFGISDHDPEIVGLQLDSGTTTPATPTVTAANVTQVYGRPATMRVTVTAPGVTPTGTVTLRVGGTTVGSGALDPATGTAKVTIPRDALAPRTSPYMVSVEYSGDPLVAAGGSTATLRVEKGASRVTAKGATGRIRAGSTRPTVTIAVTNADRVPPTGTITVSGAGTKKVTIRLRSGKAVAHLRAFRTSGAKRLTVTYAGSRYLAASRTHVTLQVVKR